MCDVVAGCVAGLLVDGAWVGGFLVVDRLPLGVGRDGVVDAGGVVDGLAGGSAVLLCEPLTASG